MTRVSIITSKPIFSREGAINNNGYMAWEIARALKRKGHEVRMLESEHEKDFVKEGISILGCDWGDVRKSVEGSQVVILPLTMMREKYFREVRDIPTVVDLVDPVLVESLFALEPDAEGMREFAAATQRVMNYIQNGDFFYCAGMRAYAYYVGMLSLAGRISPLTRESKLIASIPIAASQEAPKKPKQPFFAGKVPEGKRLILWPGRIYEWYDAEVAIKAMVEVARAEPDAALVFAGAGDPCNDYSRKALVKSQEFAKKLGLLGESVFFTGWPPHSERAAVYAEPEFAVITFPESLLSLLAFRLRAVDCLWGGLPVLSTEGDEVGDLLNAHNAGGTVKAGDAGGLAKKMVEWLQSPEKVAGMKKNAGKLVARELNWDYAIEPLDEFCRNPKIAGDKASGVAKSTVRSAFRVSRLLKYKYYAHRALALYRKGGAGRLFGKVRDVV